MTRRKAKKEEREALEERKARIAKLIAAGWIRCETEIPSDAIPVDPDRINIGNSYSRPIFYRALEFVCVDCNAFQTWEAEDQRWYYETTGAFYISTAKRCRQCRKKEQERKELAREAAGCAKVEQ